MLARLGEANANRNSNHAAFSCKLESLGFDCFLAPEGVERVYFEFIIRHRDAKFDTARFGALLKELGCQVSTPRYPLLHQQPFFTEGLWRSVSRYSSPEEAQREIAAPLPRTEAESSRILRLPNFCHPDCKPLIAQYELAFSKAMELLV